jgi:hypothetical protein
MGEGEREKTINEDTVSARLILNERETTREAPGDCALNAFRYCTVRPLTRNRILSASRKIKKNKIKTYYFFKPISNERKLVAEDCAPNAFRYCTVRPLR